MNGFQLVDIGARFTAVNMQNYKSASNPSTRAKVEQTISDEMMQGNYVLLLVR